MREPKDERIGGKTRILKSILHNQHRRAVGKESPDEWNGVRSKYHDIKKTDRPRRMEAADPGSCLPGTKGGLAISLCNLLRKTRALVGLEPLPVVVNEGH